MGGGGAARVFPQHTPIQLPAPNARSLGRRPRAESRALTAPRRPSGANGVNSINQTHSAQSQNWGEHHRVHVDPPPPPFVLMKYYAVSQHTKGGGGEIFCQPEKKCILKDGVWDADAFQGNRPEQRDRGQCLQGPVPRSPQTREPTKAPVPSVTWRGTTHTARGPQPRTRNTVFDPQLVDSTDAKPRDMEGRVFIIKNPPRSGPVLPNPCSSRVNCILMNSKKVTSNCPSTSSVAYSKAWKS